MSVAIQILLRWLMPTVLTVIRWITPYMVGLFMLVLSTFIPSVWCYLIQFGFMVSEPIVDLLDSFMPSVDPQNITAIWPILGQSSAFIDWSYILGLGSGYLYLFSVVTAFKFVRYAARFGMKV